MVKRSYILEDTEPDVKKFDIPSCKEHLFQTTDLFTHEDEIGKKLGLDENTVSVKLEVVGGDEAGRTMLNRCSLNPDAKGFFATVLFLKAIGLPYKGTFTIDTNDFIGKQFYATVKHKDGYANIDKYNFEKVIKQGQPATPNDIAWEE